MANTDRSPATWWLHCERCGRVQRRLDSCARCGGLFCRRRCLAKHVPKCDSEDRRGQAVLGPPALVST